MEEVKMYDRVIRYRIWFVLFIITCFFSLPAYSLTTNFNIHGNLKDYQWDYSSNRLAILFTSNNPNQYFIYILDADKKMFQKKINLPKSLDPNCLAWTRDETGFYLSTFNNSDDRGGIYVFDIEKHTFKTIFENTETQPYGTVDIVLDPKSDYWAFLCAEEGHPGVRVYKGSQYLLSPCLGPENFINTLKWKTGKLYCESDVMLQDDLGCGDINFERNKNNFSEGNLNSSLLYEIDPVAITAKKSHLIPKDLTNTSFDGKYYITIEESDNTIQVIQY